jgi:hypothetical protein
MMNQRSTRLLNQNRRKNKEKEEINSDFEREYPFMIFVLLDEKRRILSLAFDTNVLDTNKQ